MLIKLSLKIYRHFQLAQVPWIELLICLLMLILNQSAQNWKTYWKTTGIWCQNIRSIFKNLSLFLKIMLLHFWLCQDDIRSLNYFYLECKAKLPFSISKCFLQNFCQILLPIFHFFFPPSFEIAMTSSINFFKIILPNSSASIFNSSLFFWGSHIDIIGISYFVGSLFGRSTDTESCIWNFPYISWQVTMQVVHILQALVKTICFVYA